LRAHVGGARDVVILLRRRADDGRQVGGLEIAHRALDRLETETGMLEIEEHEVAAGGFQDVTDAGRGELDDEMAELRRRAAGKLLEPLSLAVPCGLLVKSPCPSSDRRRSRGAG